jgi:acyl-CoA synthetase (AMP-forming)/AMP-acid ligase II
VVEFNLADLWERVVDTVGGREALVCGDRRLNYDDVEGRANRLAHHLADHGVGPGDHVALCLFNGTEYLEAMLAAFKLRAVPVNVNYRYLEDELHYLLEDADAVAAVVHAELAPRVTAARARLPRLGHVVVVGACGPTTVGTGYEQALASASPARDFGPRSPDDLYVLYTGGTTGAPKGVMWRAEDIFFAAFGGADHTGVPLEHPEEIALRLDLKPRCLPLAPFMHGTAQWAAFRTLFAGGAVVISPERPLDPVEAWRLVADERVNFLAVVGDAFGRPLVDALDDLDPGVEVACCTVVLSGGASLSPGVKATWVERMPWLLIVDGYGTSETGAQGSAVTVAGLAERSTTFVVDDATTVLGDDLRPAPVGTVGRLARRGRIPLGYYKDPVRTLETFPEVDGIRWSIPGDAARIEPDGTITVLGRGGHSINTGGEKVHPEEVEAALAAHATVRDAVVVGLPDERWGERVVALVCTREPVLLDELDRHLRARLAGYKVPRDMILVDEVARTAAGKPDYRWARETARRRLGSHA